MAVTPHTIHHKSLTPPGKANLTIIDRINPGIAKNILSAQFIALRKDLTALDWIVFTLGV
jgi:hypothetical protein